MGPGVDPHSYEPRESDVSRLMNADVVFYNGIHLEGKMADLLEESAKKRIFLRLQMDSSRWISELMLKQTLRTPIFGLMSSFG